VFAEDLFSVAPEAGTIGFTDTANNEVSLLFPNGVSQPVTPDIEYVKPDTGTIYGTPEAAPSALHTISPRVSDAPTCEYTRPQDGTYREANISEATSTSGSLEPSSEPMGIAVDTARKTGNFFYAVGLSGLTNRVGHIEVKIDEHKKLPHRRDQDDFDDDGIPDDVDTDRDDDGIPDVSDYDNDNDGVPDISDDDDDNDGIPDEYDTKSQCEAMQSDSGSLAGGQSLTYDMPADANTTLLLAVVQTTDLSASLVMEIVDPSGAVVVSVPAVAGKGVATASPALPGLYTLRVRNTGLTAATYTTTLIERSIWF
jgi:hypothetical protein